MKKALSILVAVLMLALTMAGCVPSSQPAADANKPGEAATPLKVGIMPSAVGAPVQYALEKGYFEEEGVAVETVIFPSGAPINEAIAAKQLDIACSGAATIFSLATGDCKLLADVAGSGGMGIWVRPDSDIMTVKGEKPELPEMYGSAETIKGKTFICCLGTASQFNVLRYLDQFGLTDADVNIVHMEFGAGAQAFNAGEGDAIATFEPYSSQVVANGAVKCVSFEDATNTALYDMMFTRNDVISARRDDIIKFIKAFERAVEDLSDAEVRKEFCMRWFDEEGRTYDEATMDQEIIDRPYVNKALMTSGDYIFGDAMITYGQFNVDIGKIEPDNMENVENCFDPTLIEEALGVDLKVPGEA